jgi:D-arabinose 1-dehydrogenase-like Zn-dependent alcohol dehydrogenase
LRTRVDSLRSEIRAFVSDCTAKGQKVAIWGAGGKGLSMLAAADLNGLQLLVDSDPGKVGLYTPVSHLVVSPPEQIAAQNIDAVIVMAPAYEREIAANLRSRHAFAGTIVLAGGGFRIFDQPA